MKDKILLFSIGVLVGAIIATAIFYVYTTTNSNNNQNIPGGMPPDMPSGDFNGERPEMPSGERPSGRPSQASN